MPSPIDAPDDCFRVRLVCTLLDTCGSCFERGALKKKLDAFLTFFQVRFRLRRLMGVALTILVQMYALSKGTMPMDVEFMMSDTFEQLRPKLELYKTFPEAVQAVDEMLAAVAKNGAWSLAVRWWVPLLMRFFAGPGDEEVEEAGEVQDDGRRAGATDGADEADEDESSDEDSEVSRRWSKVEQQADSITSRPRRSSPTKMTFPRTRSSFAPRTPTPSRRRRRKSSTGSSPRCSPARARLARSPNGNLLSST